MKPAYDTEGPGAAAQPAPAVGLMVGGNGARVLVADDDPYVRDILSRWLSAEGYACAAAAGGDEALSRLEAGPYDLLVSDIRMPGLSGIDLLTEARRRYPDLAVVMVTAIDEKDVAVRALELGAYGYVIKPFDQSEVIINTVNALERRRLVLASRQYERGLEQKVREQTESIRASQEEIALRLIAASEYRDDETGAHIRRIGLYAEAVATALGFGLDAAEMLRLAAPMHDVGKIGIPDAILQKPGRLSEVERNAMKGHTLIGGDILAGTNIEMLNVAREIALAHHERWDGTGYPRGIAGEVIPETARIVAVVDVYDALVHRRVYRPAMPEEKALRILRENRGTQFDPRALDSFLDVLPQVRSIRESILDGRKPPARGPRPRPNR